MIKTFPNLYSRNSDGKILIWSIEIHRTINQDDIVVRYGELNGKLVEVREEDIKGKNIGKANETTSFSQAISQCNSRINKKKREGYKSLEDLGINELDINEKNLDLLLEDRLPKFRTDLKGNIKPMRCQQYYKSKKNWIDPYGKLWDDRKYFYITNPIEPKEKGAIQTKFPAIIQPKINGVRALLYFENGKAVLRSKEGLEYNLPIITGWFNTIYDFDKSLVFDGELYIHGELLQDIVSAVKKPNLNTPRITYNIFDLAIEGFTCVKRLNLLSDVKQRFELQLPTSIQFVKSKKVESDEEVQRYTDKFISEGYEGSIIREFKGEYGFGKRPSHITKLKRSISNDYTIIDIVPQEKDKTLGQYVCITPTGDRFEVNPKLSDSDKRLLLINKTDVIGKKLQIMFYEYTDKRIPFHILNNLVRDYE